MALSKKTKIIGFALPDSSHDIRGIGFYTRRLLPELKSQASSLGLKIVEFSDTIPQNVNLIHYPFFDFYQRNLNVGYLPTVVTIFDVIPLQFPSRYPPGLRGRINFIYQQRELSKTQAVITISKYSKEQIEKRLRVEKKLIHPIYLAASPDFQPISDEKTLSRVRNKFHLPKKFVLYVGDINWNKNLTRLTEACVASNLHLVIVGKNAVNSNLNLNHPELLHFKDWLATFAHNPLIHRLGFVDNSVLVALYNLASVYCLPSLVEGFGLTILEAMACKTPVACSNTSSLPEVAGNAALYFDPTDVNVISSTLKKIINSPQVASRLKNRGYIQAAKFSWSKTAAQTLEVYRSLL